MTTLWIVVGIFIVVAAGATIAMLATAWGDKKISDDVASEPGRLPADRGEDGPGDGPVDGRGEPDERGDH